MFEWLLQNREIFLLSCSTIGTNAQLAGELLEEHNTFMANCAVCYARVSSASASAFAFALALASSSSLRARTRSFIARSLRFIELESICISESLSSCVSVDRSSKCIACTGVRSVVVASTSLARAASLRVCYLSRLASREQCLYLFTFLLDNL